MAEIKFVSVPPPRDRPDRLRFELQGLPYWVQDQAAVEVDKAGATHLVGQWPGLDRDAVEALGHLLLALAGRPIEPVADAADLARIASEKLG
jgi:hypothetical protein